MLLLLKQCAWIERFAYALSGAWIRSSGHYAQQLWECNAVYQLYACITWNPRFDRDTNRSGRIADRGCAVRPHRVSHNPAIGFMLGTIDCRVSEWCLPLYDG